VSGHLDQKGSIVAMVGLTARANDGARDAVALLATVGALYKVSCVLRECRRPVAGLAAHVAFRFAAFWLSMLVMVGRGAKECTFCDPVPILAVTALTLAYAAHSGFEFAAASYEGGDAPGAAMVLPWPRYALGLVRTAGLVGAAGACVNCVPGAPQMMLGGVCSPQYGGLDAWRRSPPGVFLLSGGSRW